jgi:hypothetical protein
VKQIRKRLTYANVMSSIAVFLILGGATAIAASHLGKNSVGKKQLKNNAVTTAKIKKNAVSTPKIKANAVTTAKIKDMAVTNTKLADGSVSFAKIAPGTDVIATASGAPVTVNTETTIPIPLTGTTSFTSQAGVVDLLNIEVRGINLARTGASPCDVLVQPLVNGNLFEVSSGFLGLSSDLSVASEFDPVSLDSETGPVGMAQPGVAQQISMRVLGDKDCTAGSQVSVAIAVTQAK